MDNWNHYDTADLPDILGTLNTEFEEACVIYKDALQARTSNRATKELMRGNTKGTSIHRFECQFSWTVHELECGPKCFMDSNIRRAYGLIEHIKKSSES